MENDVELLKKKDIKLYSNFINSVFGYEVSRKAIEKMLTNNTVLIIKVNGLIVASVCIEERYEYIKNKKYYYLSYLGVLKEYRRKGYASKIFNEVERLIHENKISYLELTSGNQRRTAHYFYKSKSFKIKDTTVFVKIY